MVAVAVVVDVHSEQANKQKNEWTITNLSLQELCQQVPEARLVSALGAYLATALSSLFTIWKRMDARRLASLIGMAVNLPPLMFHDI